MPDYLIVQSLLKPASGSAGHPVALFEKNDAHPNGEIYIANQAEHTVAPTPMVMEKVRDGALEIIRRITLDPPALTPPANEQTTPPPGGEQTGTTPLASTGETTPPTSTAPTGETTPPTTTTTTAKTTK